MVKENLGLNDNDMKLLAFCRREPKSINEIAKLLEIAPSSVSVRIEKLLENNLIKVLDNGKGKKKLIQTKTKKSDTEYIVQVLKEIRLKGGTVPEMAFLGMPDIYPNAPDYEQKTMVNSYVRYSDLVGVSIHLTEEGEKFIKDNS